MEISEQHGLANRGQKGTGARKIGEKEDVEREQGELHIAIELDTTRSDVRRL